jgi:hypothetical protein
MWWLVLMASVAAARAGIVPSPNSSWLEDEVTKLLLGCRLTASDGTTL